MTRDAARGETRALGIFERRCIGCGSHWLGERLVARGCVGEQGEAVPCVQRLQGVRVEVQVHRLCALLLLPALQRNVTMSTRTSTRKRRTPSPFSKGRRGPGRPHFPTAMAHRWSPRWHPLRQAHRRAASPARGSCANGCIECYAPSRMALSLRAELYHTLDDLEELPLSKETY